MLKQIRLLLPVLSKQVFSNWGFPCLRDFQDNQPTFSQMHIFLGAHFVLWIIPCAFLHAHTQVPILGKFAGQIWLHLVRSFYCPGGHSTYPSKDTLYFYPQGLLLRGFTLMNTPITYVLLATYFFHVRIHSSQKNFFTNGNP